MQATDDYNPPFTIQSIKINNKIVNVIRDDLTMGGTKARALVPYFKNNKKKKFYYVSPTTGSAQVTLVYSAKKTGKKIVIYMTKIRPRHPLTEHAIKIGKGVLDLREFNSPMSEMWKIAEQEVQEDKESELLDLGFTGDEIRIHAINSLKDASIKTVSPINRSNSLIEAPPIRLWVTIGSGLLLSALLKVFPKCYFLGVVVGRKPPKHLIINPRVKLYYSDEPFYKKAKQQPPYNTTPEYDAKCWKFINKFAQENDYIWNVISTDLCVPKSVYTVNQHALNLPYVYKIPCYRYKNGVNNNDKTSLVSIELARSKLMNELVKKIETHCEISRKKVVKYLAKLFFNLISKRTYSGDEHCKKELIVLDDALFNLPTHSEIKNFLDDMYYNEKHKKKIDIYKIFEYFNNVTKYTDNIIMKIDFFNALEEKIKIDKKIVKEYVYYKIKNKTYKIPHNTYLRLKKKYTGSKECFDKYIVIGIVRYNTLDSGAEQFVLDPEYKKKLKNTGADFELFGSMFNHLTNSYCSLFYDIEKYFGSCGSFFGLKIKSGIYTINPPYEERMLHRMYSCVKTIMKNSIKNSKNIIITMAIPKWRDFKLETDIDKDKLYIYKFEAHDRFMDPIYLKYVDIPPYVVYLFISNNKIKESHEFTKVFVNKYDT